MGTIKIQLLGTFRLYRDHPSQEIHLMPKQQILLAFLLIQPGRTFHRDRIAGTLWGEHSEEQAHFCLNTAIWRLRKALECGGQPRGAYLLCRPDGVIGFNWESDHWLDVQEFEQQASILLAEPAENLTEDSGRQLQYILSLYNGDFMEALNDDWALGERERMRSLFMRCLVHCMTYCKLHGEYEQAMHYGDQILQIDPLREEIHCELMRIYLLAGQRPLAIRQYETCRAVLLSELGIPPMPKTRQLHSEILAEGALPQNADLQGVLNEIHSALNNLDETRWDLQNLYRLIQDMIPNS